MHQSQWSCNGWGSDITQHLFSAWHKVTELNKDLMVACGMGQWVGECESIGRVKQDHNMTHCLSNLYCTTPLSLLHSPPTALPYLCPILTVPSLPALHCMNKVLMVASGVGWGAHWEEGASCGESGPVGQREGGAVRGGWGSERRVGQWEWGWGSERMVGQGEWGWGSERRVV